MRDGDRCFFLRLEASGVANGLEPLANAEVTIRYGAGGEISGRAATVAARPFRRDQNIGKVRGSRWQLIPVRRKLVKELIPVAITSATIRNHSENRPGQPIELWYVTVVRRHRHASDDLRAIEGRRDGNFLLAKDLVPVAISEATIGE